MGYRAQVITQQREYGSSIFSDWDQFSSYFGLLTDEYVDELYQQEDTEYYEIPKEVVKKEIERLKKLDPSDEFEFQSGWAHTVPDTNDDIITAWEAALRETPDDWEYIALEWY